MTLEEHKKVAQNTMLLLKVRYVSFPIAKTEKGDIWVKFTKDQENYEIILDAVPLDLKELNNIQFKKLVEKYWFDREAVYGGFTGPSMTVSVANVDRVADEILSVQSEDVPVINSPKEENMNTEQEVVTPAQVEQPEEQGVPTEENKPAEESPKEDEPNTPHQH